MIKEQIIRDALALPTTVIDYHVSQYLADKFPEKTLVEGNDGLFNIETYAEAGLCTLEMHTSVHNQVLTRWHGQEISMMFPPHMARLMSTISGNAGPPPSDEREMSEAAKNAWFEVIWQDHRMDILVMRWIEPMGRGNFAYWILCDDKAMAQDFITAVCRWNAELREEVLVFSGGCWSKDSRLFKAIQGASFDNLVLRANLKQQIAAFLLF